MRSYSNDQVPREEFADKIKSLETNVDHLNTQLSLTNQALNDLFDSFARILKHNERLQKYKLMFFFSINVIVSLIAIIAFFS